MWCALDKHNYICVTYVQKDFRFELWLSGFWRFISFHEIAQKFHILTNIVILKEQLKSDIHCKKIS